MKDEVVNVRNAFRTVGLLDITAALVIFFIAVYFKQKKTRVQDSISLSLSAKNGKATMRYERKNIISTHEENKLKHIKMQVYQKCVIYDDSLSCYSGNGPVLCNEYVFICFCNKGSTLGAKIRAIANISL